MIKETAAFQVKHRTCMVLPGAWSHYILMLRFNCSESIQPKRNISGLNGLFSFAIWGERLFSKAWCQARTDSLVRGQSSFGLCLRDAVGKLGGVF